MFPPCSDDFPYNGRDMGWVKDALRSLEVGSDVEVRPRGHSMRGLIEDNQLIVLTPVEPSAVEVGDVVFIRWKGSYILHIVREARGSELLIGNNLGRTNGWAARSDVLARVVGVRASADPT